jgi:hypothetical protein
MRYYTGIGSRQTPPTALEAMTVAATALEKAGYTLRSGGAAGADTAFEAGVKNKEIYLPWPGFNGRTSPFHSPTSAAFEMAEWIHPAWERCSSGARCLHARNCHQVLGLDLQTPSEFVLCWTPGGEVVGGTATALRIAAIRNIPIYNMGLGLFDHLTNVEQILEAVR